MFLDNFDKSMKETKNKIIIHTYARADEKNVECNKN